MAVAAAMGSACAADYLRLSGDAWAAQVLSDAWAKMARTPTPLEPTYGYMNWFLNTDHEMHPAVREDCVTFLGNGDNMVFIDYQHDMVLWRAGSTTSRRLSSSGCWRRQLNELACGGNHCPNFIHSITRSIRDVVTEARFADDCGCSMSRGHHGNERKNRQTYARRLARPSYVLFRQAGRSQSESGPRDDDKGCES